MYCKNTSVHCPTVHLSVTPGQERLLPYKAFETITQLFAHLDGKDVNAKVGIHLQRFGKRLTHKMTEQHEKTLKRKIKFGYLP